MKLTTKDPLETELALNSFCAANAIFLVSQKENVIIPNPIVYSLTVCILQ